MDRAAANQVHIFRAGESNYNYIYYSPVTRAAIALDPFAGEPMWREAEKLGVRIQAILNTHGHWDHVGGNSWLKEKAGAPIVAFESEVIDHVDRRLKDNEEFAVEDLRLRTLHVPGHTAGHVAFQAGDQVLFIGDTLFLAGCGNCNFGGNVDNLYQSLQRLAALPDSLRIYCGHDYAEKNLAFGRQVDPENAAVGSAQAKAQAFRVRDEIWVTTLGEEKAHNIFLRKAMEQNLDAFRELRARRDRF